MGIILNSLRKNLALTGKFLIFLTLFNQKLVNKTTKKKSIEIFNKNLQ
jgi:hypothetical protein